MSLPNLATLDLDGLERLQQQLGMERELLRQESARVSDEIDRRQALVRVEKMTSRERETLAQAILDAGAIPSGEQVNGFSN